MFIFNKYKTLIPLNYNNLIKPDYTDYIKKRRKQLHTKLNQRLIFQFDYKYKPLRNFIFLYSAFLINTPLTSFNLLTILNFNINIHFFFLMLIGDFLIFLILDCYKFFLKIFLLLHHIFYLYYFFGFFLLKTIFIQLE